MTPWSDHFAAMSDEDAREKFTELCRERFGAHWKKDFANHAGTHSQTLSRWMNHDRPATWALVMMQEWKDGERERLIVERLGEFKALLDAV